MNKLHIPANAKTGDYLRYDCTGRFLSIERYLTNGLGIIMKMQADGTTKRVFNM